MNTTKDFSLFQERIEHKVTNFHNKKESLGIAETISAYDLDVVEKEIISRCESLSVPYTIIDCTAYHSHTEFCNKVRSIPEFSVVIFSRVTEIPASAEQRNIGYAINSLKNDIFFGVFPMKHMLCYLTYRPEELTDNNVGTALRPSIPGGLVRFDKEWNILRN